MNAGWITPFIILGGVLQTCGAAMNGQLGKSLVNPWLASVVSFALITSLVIDNFGWFRMDHHPINVWRALGGLLLIGGVTLIAKF